LQFLIAKDEELSVYFRMQACRAFIQQCACLHYDRYVTRNPEARAIMLEACKRHNRWLRDHAGMLPEGTCAYALE
jgi:hypothetical protein